VDDVALVLALSLGATTVLILIATMVQIIFKHDIVLSENATQVLIAGISGLSGLLGAYIGTNRRKSGE
jgi:hypothetical protein